MPGPVTSYANAVAAYGRAAKDVPTGGVEPRNAPSGEGFDDLVQGAIREAIKIGQTSERLSIAAVNDRADLSAVVTAVAEAETTLQTVVSVRDKVIEAYKEILRMPM